MLEFRYDTQLLIDGDDLDEDEVFDYIVEHFKGDRYGASLGEIYDIVVEDMDRQSRGLKG